MGFWSGLAKVASVVATVAIGAVAVAAVVATAPVALAVIATVAIGVVAGIAVAEIIQTDDIGQYWVDTADTFVRGEWADNQTALGQLGRMTLNILYPPAILYTCGGDLLYDVSHYENNWQWYLKTGLNTLAIFSGIRAAGGGGGIDFKLPKFKWVTVPVGGGATATATELVVSWNTVATIAPSTVATSAAVAASATSVAAGGGGSGGNGGGEKENPQDKTTNKNGDGASGSAASKLDDGLGTYAEQGGHHPMAKKAFEGVNGYDPDSAVTISNSQLDTFGVKHATITGQQNSLYTAYAKTGKPLTIDAMRQIEIQALTNAGVPPDYATNAVNKAIEDLLKSGVTQPVRIPWN